jgi:hypothetical protein
VDTEFDQSLGLFGQARQRCHGGGHAALTMQAADRVPGGLCPLRQQTQAHPDTPRKWGLCVCWR